MVITFDFDGTLCCEAGRPMLGMIEALRCHATRSIVYIVTSRNDEHEDPAWAAVNQPNRVIVREFIREHRLPVRAAFFTCHKPKADTLVQLESRLHYDDCPWERLYAEIAGVPCLGPRSCSSMAR